MMKGILKASVIGGIFFSLLAGCGGSKEITLTTDPKEVERLQKMMPPHMRAAPQMPEGQEEAPAQPQ